MSEQRVLASRLRRLFATGIDAIMVPSLTVLLIMVTDVVEDAEDYVNNLWMLWVLILAITSYLILNGYLLWKRGQTLGKLAMGIYIVQSESIEKALLWKLICFRALFFPLLFAWLPPFILLPLIDQLAIFSKRRRCIHDYLCGTEVIVPRHWYLTLLPNIRNSLLRQFALAQTLHKIPDPIQQHLSC